MPIKQAVVNVKMEKPFAKMASFQNAKMAHGEMSNPVPMVQNAIPKEKTA